MLEIAGGTGQHAVFFAGALSHLQWQSTDVPDNVGNLALRIDAAGLENLPAPLDLDVNQPDWPVGEVDAIFSANSLHIMCTDSVNRFFKGVGRHLAAGGLLLVYGPFKYQGEFTTPSNAGFDCWLKDRDPLSGVRDFEWVNELAEAEQLRLIEDIAMPANNQLLIWRRQR